VEGRWLALISVSIQIAVLVSLAIRHHFQIFLVRVWAIVAVIGGAAFIVSQLAQAVVIATATAEEAPAPISFTKILLGVIELSAGVYFYGASIRSTRFEHSEHEPKLEGPWTT